MFGGPHAVPQADMVVFKLMDVKSLMPCVRPGQILILVDFCHSLEVLEPLAAQGCHTIVLMPLAPNRYAFLADQEISTVVMELLTTELASVCERSGSRNSLPVLCSASLPARYISSVPRYKTPAETR